ncbi:hypothetical protein, partial [Photobacterium kishitanii]
GKDTSVDKDSLELGISDDDFSELPDGGSSDIFNDVEEPIIEKDKPVDEGLFGLELTDDDFSELPDEGSSDIFNDVEEPVVEKDKPVDNNQFVGGDESKLESFNILGDTLFSQQNKSVSESVFEDDSLDKSPSKSHQNIKNENKLEMSEKIKIAVTSALLSTTMVIVASFCGYQMYLKDNIITTSDLDNLNASNDATKATIAKFKKQISSNEAKYASVDDLKTVFVELNKLKNSEYKNKLTEHISNVEIKVNKIASQQSLSKSDIDQLTDKLNWSLAKITSGKGTSSAEYERSVKYIISLKKLIEKNRNEANNKLGGLEDVIAKNSKVISQKVDAIQKTVTENEKKINIVDNSVQKAKKELSEKVSLVKDAVDTMGSDNGASGTIDSALGITVAKGGESEGSLPTYTLRGIVNNVLYIDMPVKGTGQTKIQDFSVGQYLDGYGRIVSIDGKTLKVRTTSGLVRLLKN